jgi:hypothetical protein
MAGKVVVRMSSSPDVRYYFADWPLIKLGGLSGAEFNCFQGFAAYDPDFGEAGLGLLGALLVWLHEGHPIFKVTISMHQLTVIKNPVYGWRAIEEMVLPALLCNYRVYHPAGQLRIIRPSLVARLLYWLACQKPGRLH